jgi:hypothetical protein
MREDAVEDDVDKGVLDFFNSKNSKNKDLIAEIRPETAEFSRSRSRSNKTSDRPHTAVGPKQKSVGMTRILPNEKHPRPNKKG